METGGRGGAPWQLGTLHLGTLQLGILKIGTLQIGTLQKGTPFMERQPPLKGDPLILKWIYSNLALFLSKGKPLKKWNSFNFLTKKIPFCSCIVSCNIYAKASQNVLSFISYAPLYVKVPLFWQGTSPQLKHLKGPLVFNMALIGFNTRFSKGRTFEMIKIT